jgi:hypothetical protein
MIKYLSLVFVISLLTSLPLSADLCEEMKELKEKTYGYTPRDFTTEQQDSISKELDIFWDLVGSNKEEAIPCLQTMLETTDDDNFFSVDGSTLLLSLDKSARSLDICSKSYMNADFNNITQIGYLHYIFNLAKYGGNIGELTLKLLNQKNINIFISKHSFEVTRYAAATFLFGVMDDENKTEYMLKLTQSEVPGAADVGIFSLQNCLTQRSFMIVDSLVKANSIPDSTLNQIKKVKQQVSGQIPVFPVEDAKMSREEVLKIVEDGGLENLMSKKMKEFWASAMDTTIKTPPDYSIHQEKMMKLTKNYVASYFNNLTEEDIPLLLETRKKILSNISDESYGEYMRQNILIYSLIIKFGIYDQYLQSY